MVQLWTYTYEGAARRFLTTWLLARTTREDSATLTPTLSLSEGEGGVLVPSHPERAQFELSRSAARRGLSKGGGGENADRAFVNDAG
jgi:hypothetical protein